jgi:hypothetical protein
MGEIPDPVLDLGGRCWVSSIKMQLVRQVVLKGPGFRDRGLRCIILPDPALDNGEALTAI